MARIQRLIAATDLSAPARHAAARAALVARELHAPLDLLHVISLTPVDRLRRLLAEAPENLAAQVEADASATTESLGATLRAAYGVTVTSRVITGEVIAAIHDCAASCGSDVVVLGARGASFMRHLLLGSTAERMVRKAPRPMLVVKQPPHEPYRRILVAVDFSPSSLPALATARALAPGAELLLLHAYDVPFEDRLRTAGVPEERLQHYRDVARRQGLQGMQALLASAGLDPSRVATQVLPGDPASCILEQEQERDCDLVVVGKQGESLLEELLLGSVTRHVLQESHNDVLVCVRTPLQADPPGRESRLPTGAQP